MTERKTVAPLFRALVFLFFSVWIGLDGVRLDLLPAFLGYYWIYRVLRDFEAEYPAPRPVYPACIAAGVLSVGGWLDRAWALLPGWAGTAYSLCVTALCVYVLYHMIGLLIRIARKAGRDDLAENGARYRLIFLLPYALASVAGAVSGGVRGILLAFVIIFELAVAAFTANCEYALFR